MRLLNYCISSVSASGVETRSLYDGLGRVCTSIDGRGKITRTEYDAFGRQSATIDADNHRTTYGYDSFGQLVSVRNPLNDAVTYGYDLRGHKTYEGGATYPVRYAYDLFGNKVSMTTYRNAGKPVGDTTRWLYDEASNCMTNKVYADGKGTKYGYDAHGRLTKRTWARGIDTTYTFNAWGSLTRTDYSDGTPSVVLCYDAMGRQIHAIDAAGITTFTYDAFGSLTNETVVSDWGSDATNNWGCGVLAAPSVVTNTIERYYDAFGRDAGYALNGVRQSTLAYDPVTGRLSTMRIGDASTNWGCGVLAAPEFSWNYLANSDLKSSLAYPNGLTASWTYGNRGELLEVNNALADGSISKYAYTYDAAGRRVACAKSGTAFEQSDSVNYGYNARSELTNATAAVDTAYRYGYNFDDIGNRKSSAERGVWSLEYTANSLNQYTTITSHTARASEAFRNYYDVDGNQIRVKTATGTWQVSYNGENRPVRWQQGPTVITMSFDRMGRRVTKNDQRFVYNGYLQIANFRSTTTTSDYNYFIWDPTEPVATRPLVWHHGSSVAYYTHDGNKNVSEVIDSNNDVAAHYEYAPFGALTVSRGESAAANPFRFSSEYFEDDTATVYYNYRPYEPVTGRWLQRDPKMDKFSHLYRYCGNSVIVLFDVLGLSDLSDYFDPGFTDSARDSSPSVFDQMFGWLFDSDRQYEEYFDSRYHDTMKEYRDAISIKIQTEVDCESTSVLPSEHSEMIWGGDCDIWDMFSYAQGGYQKGKDRKQDYWERSWFLGTFTIDIDPVQITYLTDCEEGKRRYVWATRMFVVDTTGFRSNEWQYYFPGFGLVRQGHVIMAKWGLSGEGVCSCCDNENR